MENFFTAILIFDVNEFIFVCVVTIRFVCDGKICVLNYLLTRTCKSKSLSLKGRFNCITSSIKFVGLLLYFYFGEYKIYKKNREMGKSLFLWYGKVLSSKSSPRNLRLISFEIISGICFCFEVCT